MRVLVLAEYYPRSGDPVRGIWTHRQALATRTAGADIRVLVLHRPIPPLGALRHGDRTAIARELGQPRTAVLDGLTIEYVRYVSPPRPWSYGTWGAWAAPALRRALARLRADFPFELIHAHYAVPAGDAARRAAPGVPLVVSVHGGDVYGVGDSGAGRRNVSAALGQARLVLANSAGTAQRAREHGARETRVVHLGTDLPPEASDPRAASLPAGPPTLVTVGNLVARKRHADVIEALALLRDRHPGLRYVIVGGGPERPALEALARTRGVSDRVELTGPVDHRAAVETARRATVFVLPSVDEAFGVAYVEAMAGAVPAIGCAGEAGPEEIAAHGDGLERVPPRDPRALAAAIDGLLADPARRAELGRAARATVARAFTWEQCGVETVDAYRSALEQRDV